MAIDRTPRSGKEPGTTASQPARQSWSEFLRQHQRELKERSEYEYRFAAQVLAKIPDLSPAALQTQTEFRDEGGKRRFIDFTVQEPGVRIALEVDGYDKRGRGTGMTHEEFVEWTRRERAMVAAGWIPLRFANRSVIHAPDECARNIEIVLKGIRARERENAAQREKSAQLEEQLYLERNRLAEAEERNRNAEKAIERAVGEASSEVNRELERAKRERDAQARRVRDLERRLAHGSPAPKPDDLLLNEKERRELEVLNARRQQALRELAKELENARKEMRGMKIVALSMFGVVALLVGAFIVLRPSPSADRGESLVTTRTCDQLVDWSSAEDCIGRDVTICGPIVRVASPPGVSGNPTFLDMGKRYPDKSRVNLVVWGRDRSTFQSRLSRLEGTRQCVTGKLDEYDGVPTITLSAPRQLSSAN